MKILIIEDHDEKLREIVEFLEDIRPGSAVVTAKSLHTGKAAALESDVDVILLDMTMRNFERSPAEEGGRPHAFAGREIMRLMRRERATTPVIVVTQFDRFGDEDDFRTLGDLKDELADRFPNYLGTVHYRANVDTWQESLRKLLDLAERTQVLRND